MYTKYLRRPLKTNFASVYLRPPLECRIGKTQEQEKHRNRIGMHLENTGTKPIGILLKRVFG
jgi:hypothetical protein